MEVKDEIQAVILVYFMCLLEQYWRRYLGLKFGILPIICLYGASAVAVQRPLAIYDLSGKRSRHREQKQKQLQEVMSSGC